MSEPQTETERVGWMIERTADSAWFKGTNLNLRAEDTFTQDHPGTC